MNPTVDDVGRAMASDQFKTLQDIYPSMGLDLAKDMEEAGCNHVLDGLGINEVIRKIFRKLDDR